MPRSPRHQSPGAIQHVTARSNHGTLLFGNPAEYQLFLQLLWRTTREFGWSCLSYCLMPNHFHLLVRPERSNLSAGMQRLGLTYARRYNDRRDRYGHVFQGRFASSPVVDGSHLYATLRYIARHPVRAGLCAEPAAFPWSAHRALMEIDPPRLVSVHDTWRLFSSTKSDAVGAYAALVADRTADEAFVAMRDQESPTGPQTPPGLRELAETLDPDQLIVTGHLELGHSFAAIGRVIGRNRSSVARRFAKLQAERATPGT